MEISKIKKRIVEEIDKSRDKIIGIAEKIFSKLEMGFRETETAKLMALTVVDLLSNGAMGALEIKNNFKPKLTKEEYIKI